jgi:ribosomal protein S18 acetylase RimI-like enzyme
LVAAFLAEEEAAFGRTPRISATDVRAWWVRSDLATGSWLLSEDGRTVALGWMDLHGDVAFAAGIVGTGEKGRGLGTLLLEHAEKQARERGASQLLQHSLAEDAAAHELLRLHGYREARRHWEMAIEMEEEPAEPKLPDGLEIDTFREDEAREYHDAVAEAFADEWGFVSLPFDEWWAMRKDDDQTLWFVIRDAERIAAYARCEAGRHGGGFVGMLGVRRAWRKRGLGLALLLHSFRVFWDRGLRRVSLGVDAENATGATRLYERAGMHVESEEVTWEKALA